MIVRVFNAKTGERELLDVSQILIYTDLGAPIAAAAAFGGNEIKLATIRDDEFPALARSLGETNLPEVHNINAKSAGVIHEF